ncbi:hypothetical protein [Amorphus sp. MBR-141]
MSRRPPPPPEDWTERWGRRIGRGLGYVAALGLIVYLVLTYL